MLSTPVVYSVGHSLHKVERFIDILRLYDIETLLDVRSAPSSTRAPQFNRKALKESLELHGLRYLFGGAQLGGGPRGTDFYDDEGRALYWKMASTEDFSSGIDGLVKLAGQSRTAIMCSEEDPKDCHRRLLIGKVILRLGVDMIHLRGDGSQNREPRDDSLTASQSSLFGSNGDENWKSIRSVLLRNQHPSSSNY